MSLPEVFRGYGTAILAENPQVVHEWSAGTAGVVLHIPARAPDGFAIGFDVAEDGVLVSWGNWHTHFDAIEGTERLVENLFGLLRDMLSPNMRIREFYAGPQPYRGLLESFDGMRWSTEQRMGLILWNYFARRSVRTYSNAILPVR